MTAAVDLRSSRRFLPPAMGWLVDMRQGGGVQIGLFRALGRAADGPCAFPAHPLRTAWGAANFAPWRAQVGLQRAREMSAADRGVSYTKVCTALKHMPAVDLDPLLSR